MKNLLIYNIVFVSVTWGQMVPLMSPLMSPNLQFTLRGEVEEEEMKIVGEGV